ncbi:hypothetical protein [Fibrella forsythiae]|uniref:Molybdenum ABC transporter permease n=1 Tax=Fibrella forsythiae TaxID=2817061 RepID=A0ABS3JSU1_9BACT|nr:hypothetical protein [Fibrella forsythiae]MBO0953048.1 hypothetical protein [Fibrella forsythiae]
MYYGISLIVVGLLLRYLLARNKLDRTPTANVRQYDSFEAYRNNMLLRAGAKLVGLLSVLTGMLLIGLALAKGSP